MGGVALLQFGLTWTTTKNTIEQAKTLSTPITPYIILV